jgi:hypothetical protein
MNDRTYIYDIVIGPNQNDDSIKPISILNDFINSNDSKNKVLQSLPNFITTY